MENTKEIVDLKKIEEFRKKYADKIQDFILMDDTFLNAVFNDKKCAEILLSIILEKNLEVVEIKTQYNIQNLKGRSARLDIRAKDKDGKIYNCEVENSNDGAVPERARYNSSLIDAEELPKSIDWKQLPDTYIIMITRNDVLKGGKPIYHIERTIKELDKKPFCDRNYIIYVNSKIQDDTKLGRLMHDFYCSNPKDMYNKTLANRVKHFKDNEKGEIEMCAIMDEIAQEAAQEATIKTAIEYCQDFGLTKNKAIKNIVEKYSLTENEATDKVNKYWK